MTIILTPDLEKVVFKTARDQNTTAEALVLDALREKFSSAQSQIPEPRDDWERRLLRVGTPCGVSASDEALSSEGLYSSAPPTRPNRPETPIDSASLLPIEC